MAKHYGQSWPENVDHRGMSRSSPLLTQEQEVHSGGCCNSSQPLIVNAQRMLLHVPSHSEPETTPPLVDCHWHHCPGLTWGRKGWGHSTVCA